MMLLRSFLSVAALGVFFACDENLKFKVVESPNNCEARPESDKCQARAQSERESLVSFRLSQDTLLTSALNFSVDWIIPPTARGVVSFKLDLAQERECQTPIVSRTAAKDAHSMTFDELPEGIYFGCLYAKVSSGVFVPAENNGMRMVIDRSVPELSIGMTKISSKGGMLDAAVQVSDTSSFTYKWTQTAGDETLVMENSETAQLHVKSAADGDYKLELTITDELGWSTTQTIELIWDTSPPLVSVGTDQATASAAISLSGSTDTTAVETTWEILSQPPGSQVNFSAPGQPASTVTVSMNGLYEFQLTVADALDNKASDRIVILYDSIAPSGTIALVPTVAGYVNTQSPTIVLTRDADATHYQLCSNATAAGSDCSGILRAWTAYSDNPAAYNFGSDGSKSLYIQFKDAAGNIGPSLASNTLVVDTLSPGAPSAVSVPAYAAYIPISFTGGAELHPADFNIMACTANDCLTGCVGAGTTGTSPGTISTGLVDGISYYACVQGADLLGQTSSWTASAGAVVYQAMPPNPTSPAAVADSFSQITLNWSSGGESTVGFRISYQSGPTAPATCSAGTTIAEGSIAGTSHAISGLGEETQYSFRICAINNRGTPDVSSGVSVTQTTLLAGKFISLTQGWSHVCGLRSDGAAYCWGDGGNGKLGDGGTSNRADPVAVSGGHTFLEISGGELHTCGIRSDGAAYCWGDDDYGQLGNGAGTASQSTPVLVTGSQKFIGIATGAQHSCGLASDGLAYCWGDDGHGQLGNGAGTFGDQQDPIAVTGGHAFLSLSAGAYHTCGIKADGTAYCWGADSDGELGNGAGQSGDQQEPTLVTGSHSFKALAAGQYHTCALRADGAIYCWGFDGSGQLGNGSGTSGNQQDPILVTGSHSFRSLAVGNQHSCAIRGDGAAYCWGDGSSGELGNGASIDAQDPVAVTGSHVVKAIAAGNGSSCAIRSDGTLYCWGGGASNYPVAVKELPSTPGNFIAVSAGFYMACGIRSDGKAYCWGDDSNDRLGNGPTMTSEQHSPSLVLGGHRFIALTARGNQHTCGLAADGTAYCWGSSDKLGNGDIYSSIPYLVSGSHQFIAIEAVETHTCALRPDGQAYCWGFDYSGELANGAGVFHSMVPDPVAGGHVFVSISSECAIKSDGNSYCWGDDGDGEVGNGPATTGDQYIPSLVDGSHLFKSIQAGVYGHSCGVRVDGAAYCWGNDDGSYGAVGNGPGLTGDQVSPSPVAGGLSFKSITTGGFHTCAVSAEGTGYCWGDGRYGRLGTGTSSNQVSPALVAGSHNFKAIAAGTYYTCALRSDGAAYCWGDEYMGELGDGPGNMHQLSPVRVMTP